ncbi:hypothetical protein Ae201684_011093 [Aphanomyces euteiches]|uniref:FYVE-type domain-containing protein n=1 Tax=Aphanomyces euteiches TaxID=100861 RepID=A0A6G0WW58_9STRA|nr:hypothetical protein Ae201684_011093 [Aphanomyces euteiches]KAH9136147.1 hypothetical protein AeRB84_018615 [Aphanomyces euteiches]
MLFGPQVPQEVHSNASLLSSSLSMDDGFVEKKKKKRPKAKKTTEEKPSIKREKSKKKITRTSVTTLDMTCMYPTVWKNLKYRRKTTAGSLHKPICVTGVDGFVAAWIVAELLVRGYKVKGTVQNKNDDTSKLYELPHAKKNLTIVETSLLTAQSCDLAVDGCDFVIHTGTPTSCSVRDPYSEKQEPGVYSISSRVHCIVPMMNNFITACVRAKVKRVVLTSSIAAMADHVDINSRVGDLDWNGTSSLDRNPHFLSLKLAEEAAWQLVKNESMELVTINPGTLVGPSLCNSKIPPGTQVIYDLIVGHYSALVNLNFAMVDVRDCAVAHVLALEHTEARGRYICVNRSVWLKEIVQVLSKNGYSGRDLPLQVGLPNWVAKFGYSLQLGQVGVSLYADDPTRIFPSPYANEKLLDVFRFNNINDFRDISHTILDAAADLLKWKLIKPWAEDHYSTSCECCDKAFNVYRRKHHCRECGTIVCGDCSMSRVVVEGFDDKQRFCDTCVSEAVPALLSCLKAGNDMATNRKAVIVLESLMENQNNHDLFARRGGIPVILAALHSSDEIVSMKAAGTLHKLSLRKSTALHLVLEGTVLHMLEMEEGSVTWRACLQGLKNIWRYIASPDFKTMLYASLRVTGETAQGAFRGNVMLSLVHLMDPKDWPSLITEGLITVLLDLLRDDDEYSHRTVALAIKHMLPTSYHHEVHIEVPKLRERYDRNNEPIDVWFMVGAHRIAANRVVLSVQNPYFKSMLGTFQKDVEIDDCSSATFSLLIDFIYTEEINIDLTNALDLLIAASNYRVVELQKRVERFLTDEITVFNVMTIWAVADQCHAEDLRVACVAFLLRNICTIVTTDGFLENHMFVSGDIVEELCNALGGPWTAYFNKLTPKDLEPVVPLPEVDPEAELVDALSERSSYSDSLFEGVC